MITRSSRIESLAQWKSTYLPCSRSTIQRRITPGVTLTFSLLSLCLSLPNQIQHLSFQPSVTRKTSTSYRETIIPPAGTPKEVHERKTVPFRKTSPLSAASLGSTSMRELDRHRAFLSVIYELQEHREQHRSKDSAQKGGNLKRTGIQAEPNLDIAFAQNGFNDAEIWKFEGDRPDVVCAVCGKDDSGYCDVLGHRGSSAVTATRQHLRSCPRHRRSLSPPPT